MLPWLIVLALILAAIFSAPIFPRSWRLSGALAAVAAAMVVILAVGRW